MTRSNRKCRSARGILIRRASCLLLALWATASCAGTAPNEASFELVWRTVDQTHFDPTFGGVDWQAAYERYEPLVAAAKSDAEFYSLVNEMLFELDLSHLLVLPREEMKLALPVVFAEGSTGLDIRLMDGEAVVTSVAPGSAAEEAGIRPGEAIRSIDGMSVTKIVEGAEARQVPPFNSRNRTNRTTHEILGRIYGPPQTQVRLEVVDKLGEARVETLERRDRGSGVSLVEALPPFHFEVRMRRLGDDIVYLRFNHFASQVNMLLTVALARLGDAQGMVIDLRGTPGGFFSASDALAKRLIKERTLFSVYRLRDRTIHNTLQPLDGAFEGPLVVLVDVMSMSASEFFAACLQGLGRATIVGERTPGYMLGAMWKRLPNGGAFMHTIMEPRTAEGTVLEGQGVVPDISVGLDRALLYEGRDSQIEAAVRHILEDLRRDDRASDGR